MVWFSWVIRHSFRNAGAYTRKMGAVRMADKLANGAAEAANATVVQALRTRTRAEAR